jgi:hypothetical protein
MSYIDCTPVHHDVCKLVHYFVNGPHPQKKLYAIDVTIPPGQKLNVDGQNVLWNVREKSDDRCETFDKEIQVDITHCSSGEDAPSNNLGWIAAFDYGRFTYTPPEDCKPNECTPGDWVEISRSEKEYGEWGRCPQVEDVVLGCAPEKCYECRPWTQEVVYSNGCDQRSEKINGTERRETECPPPPPPCELPAEGTTLSWSGKGDPQTECEAFGSYDAGLPADFWICKAGTDREVMYSYPEGSTCSNGKDISHVTTCVCGERD